MKSIRNNKVSCVLAIVAGTSICVATLPGATERRAIRGYVTARDGTPIPGVLIIPSGTGLAGWTQSDADGSFKLAGAGAFVSFRHAKFKPRLVHSSDLTEPIHVQMDAADETVWNLKSCGSLADKKHEWIGGGLRVNPGTRHKGPINGEHDTHWYVRRGRDWLHIVDGYAWHAGLPTEQILARSESISVRSWVFRDIVGLDLSGRNSDGKYWRWVGAPVAAAIEYRGVSRESADYFDKILETTCFGAP